VCNTGEAYRALRVAAGHMAMIGDPLAGAIAKQFPAKYPGDGAAAGSAVRATLTLALREHVYLAADATGAALGGRKAEFEAAAAALDGNSQDIDRAICSVYGAGAEAGVRARRGALDRHPQARRPPHRLGVRRGWEEGVPAALETPYRVRGGLYG